MSNQQGEPFNINTDLKGKEIEKETESYSIDLCRKILICLSRIIVVLTFPFSMCLCLYSIPEYQRAVQFRLGRILSKNPLGPGLVFILPCVDNIFIFDLRIVTFDVPPQEILTKDSCTIQVDAVVYYRVYDTIKAILAVENYMKSTELLAQAALRNVLGAKTLTEIIVEKDTIAINLNVILAKATEPWGITVERVEIKDVRLPKALQRAMAAEAEAMRVARGKIVAAEGEAQASIALKEASETLCENPVSIQLRYLHTISSIAMENNKTIIFPLPIDLLKSLTKS